MRQVSVKVAVLGGGPAGVGACLALIEAGLDSLALIEKSNCLGSGLIGNYRILSDSHAESFLKCLAAAERVVGPLQYNDPAISLVNAACGRPVSLQLVGQLLGNIGRRVGRHMLEQGLSVLLHSEVVNVHVCPKGKFRIGVTTGEEHIFVLADRIVVATGAKPQSRLPVRLLGSRTLHSANILSEGGDTRILFALRGNKKPKVLIVGGSHSAVACATQILEHPSLSPSSVTIAHRRPLVPMFDSAEHARSEGFDAFNVADICKLSGRVFPLAGFRSESREFVSQMLELGGRRADPRVTSLRLSGPATDLLFEQAACADLIVDATGYTPELISIIDSGGARITLGYKRDAGRVVFVDAESRLLAGEFPVPGAYGIGLSMGYPMAGRFGEESFTGEANGISLWFGAISARMASHLLSEL